MRVRIFFEVEVHGETPLAVLHRSAERAVCAAENAIEDGHQPHAAVGGVATVTVRANEYGKGRMRR